MSIERELQKNYQELFYPPMPESDVQVAAGPTRVGRAGVPYQTPSMGDAASVGGAMLDMGASAVKGATQGFIGLPGDIEGIGRLILGKMGVNVDKATALPTTEEVKNWLDTNLGSVAGGQNPYESIGEVAAPGGQVKAVKAVSKSMKTVKKVAAGAGAGTIPTSQQEPK
jgi:hypothetical protein